MIRIQLIVTLMVLAMVTHTNADNTCCRRSYIKATLPYDASCTCAALVNVRKATNDERATSLLEQTLLEDLLRLHVCLTDRHISEADKRYARAVMPKIIAYVKTHPLAQGYVPGKKYTMLPEDLILPSQMVIRDVYDSIIKKGE